MGQSAKQIVNDISDFMREHGGRHSEWCIGMAADARQRLFLDRQLSLDQDAWIYRQAPSPEAARSIEKAYVDVGCSRDASGADAGSQFVYAYRKSRGAGQ